MILSWMDSKEEAFHKRIKLFYKFLLFSILFIVPYHSRLPPFYHRMQSYDDILHLPLFLFKAACVYQK